ncbi:hypothetical protein FQA39_LY00618 [Lamprigera yunnana]|nr:hypothetical protein FQA39_LY00618 [Lamprigera yunnana]
MEDKKHATNFTLGENGVLINSVMRYKSIYMRSDNVRSTVHLIEVKGGHCLADIKIKKEHTNSMEIVHGGFLTTLVEILTTIALISHENCGLLHNYSIQTHMRYINVAAEGDTLLFDSNTIKAGKNIAHLECLVTNKSTGLLIVKGNHTKYILRDKKF